MPATWCYKDSIPSTLEAGHNVIAKLVEALEKAGWAGRDLFRVQLATEEAMVNSITHGNKLQSDKVVEVDFKVDRQFVSICIMDQGDGFNPSDVPDPRDENLLELAHGRGVLLIRELMDKVEYNAKGNQVCMHKMRCPDIENLSTSQ